MNKEPLKDVILKVEKKLNNIPSSIKSDLKDIITCQEIIREGKSLDRQMMQKVVSWLYNEEL